MDTLPNSFINNSALQTSQ